MSQPDSEYPQFIKDVKYGEEHALQNLDICIPRPVEEASDDSLWIVPDSKYSFIHGGAWCDPSQDKAELNPALSQLLEHLSDNSATHLAVRGAPPCLRHVVGLASINYGLSGGPETDGSRSNVHPAHARDVLKALKWLEKHHGVGKKWAYMAVGHSCGATLAFQAVMDRRWDGASPSRPGLAEKILSFASGGSSGVDGSGESSCAVAPPVALVGLEGVYDLGLMVNNHADQPEYRKYIVDAFGDDEKVWDSASPTAGDYSDRWPEGHLVVLGHSPEDELVEWAQVDAMVRVLLEQGWKQRSEGKKATPYGRRESWVGGKQFFVTYLKGTHDEVWEKGTELSRTIEFAIRMFFREE